MAKTVAELEEQAICLSTDVFLTIPAQYHERPDADDALNRAWNNAVEATMRASVACERLGDLLRAKAGITGPGPTARFFTDDPEDGESQAVSVDSGPESEPCEGGT